MPSIITKSYSGKRFGDEGGDASSVTHLYLNVYDITPVNNYLDSFGLGIFHSGIEVHGKEYGFGAHEYAVSGVFEVEPKSCPGFAFRRSVWLGTTNMSCAEIRLFIEDLSEKYYGDTYHLIIKNCNHFTNEVFMHLSGKPIPGWDHCARGSLKINVDGSWEKDGLAGGVGFLIRNPNGDCLLATSIYVTAAFALEMELLAIKNALQYIYSHQYLETQWWIIESDCKSAVELISQSYFDGSHMDSQFLEEAYFLFHRLKNCNLVYVPRAANLPADWLAKHARHNLASMFWDSDWPPDLCCILDWDLRS